MHPLFDPPTLGCLPAAWDALVLMPGLSFEEHAEMMAAALDGVEARSHRLAEARAAAAWEQASIQHDLREAHDHTADVISELEGARRREHQLRQEVARLTALLEASRLQARFKDQQVAAALLQEQAVAAALQGERDAALESRDEAVTELAIAYADIEAMQATLADSALYVRQLRAKVVDMELSMQQQARTAAAAAAAAAARQQRDQQPRARAGGEGGGGSSSDVAGGGGGAFSLASIRTSIQAAVAEAGGCEPEERKRRIRQLQLRWHPDKNPVLKEFATEVTKLIHEAVTKLGDK